MIYFESLCLQNFTLYFDHVKIQYEYYHMSIAYCITYTDSIFIHWVMLEIQKSKF